MLKSMRDATPKSSMFGSDEARIITESPLDQQMSMQLSAAPAASASSGVIERQLNAGKTG